MESCRKRLLADRPLTKLTMDKTTTNATLNAVQHEIAHLRSSHRWIGHVSSPNSKANWEVFPLRGISAQAESHEIRQAFENNSPPSPNLFEDYLIMSECPAIQLVLNELHCSVLSVRLIKLQTGSTITGHSDSGFNTQADYVQLHYIIENNDMTLTIAGERVAIGEGEWWYFNAEKMQGITNQVNSDQIHLVVDCLVNPWLVDKINVQPPLDMS
ncbi:Uncharacterised protein [BD1-7 clade bacterium]|uniref:Aspartyl/asparaginy/proline hydroxylase domain-containing protein n=1 Tax=BD1-7 clade bacterium TaxID=2029982 RepID=A0A5S9PNM8_9GAMM|nr:Uncharacterised protein [BD1-7 clade bacterium]